ncbi:hypothetical protein P4234_15505 [Pseudomonas aeruginosa]|nr:hypothetical protein [Pseudomonas aeruginosa]
MQAFSKQQLIDALNAQSSDLATLQSLVMGLYLWIRDSHGQASVDAAFQRRPRGGQAIPPAERQPG